MIRKINWDAWGIGTSVACAIHCAVLPLFLSSLPLFGINLIENLLFEYAMILVAFIIGAVALYHGRRKHHHNWLPLSLFTAGILFLTAKMIWHEWHLLLLMPAVVLIVSAHVVNFRLCRSHNHCHADDCDH